MRDRIRAKALKTVRRGRPVAWVPDWMNLGNLLFVGLWASKGLAAGEDRHVLLHESRRPALDLFPALRDAYFIGEKDVRFTDQRVTPWWPAPKTQPPHFDDDALAPYIRDHLMPGSGLDARPRGLSAGDFVVNVRRGDYFSVEAHRREFGMDTRSYVLQAVTESIERFGAPDRFVFVSDDVDWCSTHLSALADIAPTTAGGGDVQQDLRAIVHAPRLLITNSTFSYWGGYIGDALNPGREVVTPWLFSRGTNGGRSYHHRPHWHLVEDIPGGWGVPATAAVPTGV